MTTSSSSGDAKVDFPITYQVQDKHTWQGTVGGGGPMLNVQTSSGNLSVLSKLGLQLRAEIVK